MQQNPYISTDELSPSRYALGYLKPNPALDTENLHQDINNYYDFGDNKFQYFKGNSNKRLEDNFDEEDEADSVLELPDFGDLGKFIPKNVLSFLNKPIGDLL